MTTALCIDYREKKIISLLNENFVGDFQVENLEVGDFIFKKQETPLLIIERKTTSDLMASIIDGRFRDQKQRLALTNLEVCYIIEKDSFQMNDKHRSMYRGSIVNLIFKHRFNVLYSNSPNETKELLATIFNKINKGEMLSNFDPLTKNEGTGTFNSKSKLISDNMFISQLCLIKGISKSIADKIIEKYKSPKDLINAYETGIESPEDLLAELLLQNGKRLGKVLSKRIYESYTT